MPLPDPTLKQRFIAKIRLLTSFDSPVVITVYGVEALDRMHRRSGRRGR